VQVYTFDLALDRDEDASGAGAGWSGGSGAIPGKVRGDKAGDHELEDVGLEGKVRGSERQGELELVGLTVGIPSATSSSFARTLVRGLDLQLQHGQVPFLFFFFIFYYRLNQVLVRGLDLQLQHGQVPFLFLFFIFYYQLIPGTGPWPRPAAAARAGALPFSLLCFAFPFSLLFSYLLFFSFFVLYMLFFSFVHFPAGL